MFCMNPRIGTLAAATLSAFVALAMAPSRMDRSRINVGAWRLSGNARTEAHVKDLKACGVDFVVTPLDRATLDLFAKHGVGCFLLRDEMPLWHGGGHPDSGKMQLQRPLSLYDAACASFKDHPAIWGLYIGDEPSALDIPWFGRIAGHCARRYRDKVIFLNLFPGYALPEGGAVDRVRSQLGAADYRAYIGEYCRNVPLDYICYDHYPWGWGNKPFGAIGDLAIVSDACAGTGRSLWVVMQSSRHADGESKQCMNVGTLRFQANTALAFGAETVVWACWSRAWGGWDGTVLDAEGRKTEVYESLRTVNMELHRLSPAYMRFRRTHTDLVGFPGEDARLTGQPSFAASNGAVFHDVRATDGQPLVVGHFVARDGSGARAMYVVACDDPNGGSTRERHVAFRLSGKSATAFTGDGNVSLERGEDGTWTFPIRSNCGVLIECER